MWGLRCRVERDREAYAQTTTRRCGSSMQHSCLVAAALLCCCWFAVAPLSSHPSRTHLHVNPPPPLPAARVLCPSCQPTRARDPSTRPQPTSLLLTPFFSLCFVQQTKRMASRGLGIAQHVLQLRKLTLTFCRHGGSSRGMRCAPAQNQPPSSRPSRPTFAVANPPQSAPLQRIY